MDEQQNQRYIKALKELQNDLITSRLFLGDRELVPEETVHAGRQDEQEVKTSAVQWGPDTKHDFETILDFVPDLLRSIVEQVISNISEENAGECSEAGRTGRSTPGHDQSVP